VYYKKRFNGFERNWANWSSTVLEICRFHLMSIFWSNSNENFFLSPCYFFLSWHFLQIKFGTWFEGESTGRKPCLSRCGIWMPNSMGKLITRTSGITHLIK
jgi:hypothetical protein